MQISDGCESAGEVITYMADFDEQPLACQVNTKVENCFHVIKMINYSNLFHILFFPMPYSTSLAPVSLVVNSFVTAGESMICVIMCECLREGHMWYVVETIH